MERISPKRMKAAFPDWLPKYRENNVDNHIKFLLQKMSASTLARFIKKIKKNEMPTMKGLTSTSPARYMKNKVPYIKNIIFHNDTLSFKNQKILIKVGDSHSLN